MFALRNSKCFAVEPQCGFKKDKNSRNPNKYRNEI